MSEAIKSPVELKIRLDWSELDLFGHINNVMFFKYIQASRVHYWDTIHLMREFGKTKIGPILVSTNCQFKKPLFFPGHITIQARVDFIKNTSMGIHHVILNDNKEVAAEAHDVIVLFNFNNNEKVSIPQELRTAIEQLESKKL